MIRLEELRKQKGLSQRYMADILKITQQAYSNYENGRREPDFNTLTTISKFFEVSIDWILGNTDDPTSPNAKLKWSDLDVSFFEGKDNLTNDEKEKLLEYMEFLISQRDKQNKDKK